jgi:lipase
MTYRTHDVAVDGGTIRVGDWGPAEPDSPADPTVIALHGVTASHLAWAAVAGALPKYLPKVRLVAPDLRGRGRSAGLPGPYGMARHAEDLEAVIEALELPAAILLGHSMGGFVAVVSAHLFPDRFSDLLLIDGGIPLALPEGISKEDLLEATLGPAARRLSMTFPDRATYLEFWKAHPAFAADPGGDYLQCLVDYADYDLTGTEPHLRPSASLEAVRQDSMDLYGGGVVLEALGALKNPFTLMTAPAGLLNEVPGLYSPSQIERWRAELPAATVQEVPDVNHYTIVMGQAGASAIAREVVRLRSATSSERRRPRAG